MDSFDLSSMYYSFYAYSIQLSSIVFSSLVLGEKCPPQLQRSACESGLANQSTVSVAEPTDCLTQFPSSNPLFPASISWSLEEQRSWLPNLPQMQRQPCDPVVAQELWAEVCWVLWGKCLLSSKGNICCPQCLSAARKPGCPTGGWGVGGGCISHLTIVKKKPKNYRTCSTTESSAGAMHSRSLCQ